MRKLLIITLALCLWRIFALPQGALASGELVAGDDYGCWGPGPQNPNPFTPTKYTYVFAGSCNLAQTRLNLSVSVPWTGVGNYEPATGNTSEDIIVPAPRIDQPSRPYGRFTVTMHCWGDPWLNQNVTCDRIAPIADSPLDHTAPNAMGWKPPFALGPYIVNAINYSKRPFTASMTDDARNNLNRLYGAFQAKYQADLAAQRKEQAIHQALTLPPQQQQMVINQAVSPAILLPTAGQRFFAETTVPIKLSPLQGWNVTGYMVSIQRKNANGNWIVQTNIPVAAAQAQSATGYTGFGAGGTGPTKSPVLLTAPGSWGLKAQVSSPNQSGWSNLVEFTVTAPPPAAVKGTLKGFGK